jgi:hypothetical protein
MSNSGATLASMAAEPIATRAVRPLALVPILFLLADPSQAAGLSGRFRGAYECSGGSFAVVVNFTEDGRNKITGDIFIEAQPVPFGQRRMSRPVKASGTFDERTAAFSFRTDDRLYIGHDLGSRKSERVPFVLQGTRYANTGFIGGAVEQQGCTLFALAPEGTNQFLFSQFVDLVRYEQDVRRGFVPIELRPFGGPPDRRQPYFVYADSVASATVDRRDLLDAVAQELSDAGLKCVSSSKVTWSGAVGVARSPRFSRPTHVVACSQHCDGLRYSMNDQLQVHYGRRYAVPVLSTIFVVLGGPDSFPWRFEKTDPTGPDPDLVVTSWGSGFASGSGCREVFQ